MSRLFFLLHFRAELVDGKHSPGVISSRRYRVGTLVKKQMERTMKWAKPRIEEVCIGLEINDYLPAEL
jgi:coenzyme PQQ precursor peptide PqqA